MNEEDDGDDSADERIHVYPTQGRLHDMSAGCWCEPEPHPLLPNLWIHRSIH